MICEDVKRESASTCSGSELLMTSPAAASGGGRLAAEGAARRREARACALRTIKNESAECPSVGRAAAAVMEP